MDISEAAQKLFISQPSLSAAIQNLEKEMGVTAFFTPKERCVVITREGEERLSFQGVLEQADIMQSILASDKTGRRLGSCQHYSFAVNVFVDLRNSTMPASINLFCARRRPERLLDDVAQGKSEVGILYLSAHNEEVLTKLMKKNGLVFEELFVAEPHVFICRERSQIRKEIHWMICDISVSGIWRGEQTLILLRF